MTNQTRFLVLYQNLIKCSGAGGGMPDGMPGGMPGGGMPGGDAAGASSGGPTIEEVD